MGRFKLFVTFKIRKMAHARKIEFLSVGFTLKREVLSEFTQFPKGN